LPAARAVGGDQFLTVVPLPDYDDAQAKGVLFLGPQETLSMGYFGARDRFSRSVPATDAAFARSDERYDSFDRMYVSYVRTGNEELRVTPWVGIDQNRYVQSVGNGAASAATTGVRYGLRARHTLRVVDRVTADVGLDSAGTLGDHMRVGTISRPPREGDVAPFGQPPSDRTNADRWQTHVLEVAPHSSVTGRWGPVSVTGGARLNVGLFEVSRSTPRIGQTPPVGTSRFAVEVDPRISARWEIAQSIAVFGAVGFHRMPPSGEDMSSVYGNPALTYLQARHVLGGAFVRVAPVTAEVTGFYKALSGLPLRNIEPYPALTEAVAQEGVGRAFGAQVLVRLPTWKGLSGWIAYTLSRSDRRFGDGGDWRLADFDQTHVLSTAANYSIGPWNFGARFRYATGMPRTPVVGAYYDVRRDVHQPLYGPQNSVRLPDFAQLDLRVERSFQFKQLKLATYIDAMNVTAQQNGEEFVFSSNYAQQGTLQGLPFVASVGARVEF
jgi:hypothetical protein